MLGLAVIRENGIVGFPVTDVPWLNLPLRHITVVEEWFESLFLQLGCRLLSSISRRSSFFTFTLDLEG